MISTEELPLTSGSQNPASAATLVRDSMTAARLSFTWLGVRKSLTRHQKDQAADSFDAEGKFLSAGKKLLDISHPAFRQVTAVRGRATQYWKTVSLPYPEPGIRLIRREHIKRFSDAVAAFRTELIDAVLALNDHYAELRVSARERLGELFCNADYPTSLLDCFDLECDFPSVEPPDYLRRLNPALYEQECQRMKQRFDEAVRLTEAAFTEELAKLVDHLAEKISGTDDGKPKVFRDSAVENMQQFFERFQSLNIHSNEQLDDLVNRAEQLMSGVQPQQLRRSETTRQHIATGLASVQSTLDQLLVDRPRRNIQRRRSQS
ncbi:MAG: hypothetical protein WBH28_01335 [Fuerstiella sp.]|jgi:hypothetical protein